MTSPFTLAVTLDDETSTARLMADIGLLIGARDVVTLSGDLGAGKTAAARALIRYLANDPQLEVPSPTFTLAQIYDFGAFPVLHADLYRIQSPQELDEIGLSPMPDDALVLIEWPERASDLMPADRIDIMLRADDADKADGRTAVITGHGTAAGTVTRLGKLRSFLERSAHLESDRIRMAGDASTRSYARLLKDDVSSILMNSPARTDTQLIYNGKSYLAAVHLAEDIRPFVAIGDGLQRLGLSVPAIHDTDLDAGFLISEDLGTEGVLGAGMPPVPIQERYEAAADVLVMLHESRLPLQLPLRDNKPDYVLPAFDVDAMMIEVSLLLDWYLPDRGVTVSPAMREDFQSLWRSLLIEALAVQPTWAIRDYHSPNIIWLPDRHGIQRVGIIDFQDAVLGPPSYDVVSLAQDARVDMSEQLEIALVSRYVIGRRKADGSFDPAAFAKSYAMMSAQRNTRLLGVFARLNRRDGKPHYLRHQPRIWAYLQRALGHPALRDYRTWFTANVPPPA